MFGQSICKQTLRPIWCLDRRTYWSTLFHPNVLTARNVQGITLENQRLLWEVERDDIGLNYESSNRYF